MQNASATPDDQPVPDSQAPTGDPNYLVGLDLNGRRVVVVGGGTVAQRRLGLLIASGADVHVISR
ncbi:NAD(P)-dependent oxidoreductase, partial [Nocardia concava]|uniref:NAD(P)-dependent oxidoreductase n=1 Tax=Nocardia concava TaxID=257281 RepID=UPI0005946859